MVKNLDHDVNPCRDTLPCIVKRYNLRMREIPLTQGKIALVDDEDYELVSRYKWCASRQRNTWYAESRIDGKIVYMHKIVMGHDPEGRQVDHRDGCGLMNVRRNLRFATRHQQRMNQGPRSDNTSGYKGVGRTRGRWRAYSQFAGVDISLGVFDTPEDAARSYDAKARELFGDFARTNFP
jgi:hypothetical protein